MRISVIGSSKRFFSGITTHTVFLANALAERGHEVSVALFRNLVPLMLYPGRGRVGRGDYIVDFRPGIRVYDGIDWNSPRSWVSAARFIMSARPEGVIGLWWTSSVAHAYAALALILRSSGVRPLVLEVHEVADPIENGFLPLRLYSRLAARGLVRLFDLVTVPASAVAEEVSRALGVARSRMAVVPIGSYDSYFTGTYEAPTRFKEELGLDGFVVLCFGTLRPYKGVEVLLEAFDLLPEEAALGSTLLIAGEDWGSAEEIRRRIERSPYGDRIILKAEFIPDHLVPRYFAAADVVVLPYLRSCGSGVAHLGAAHAKAILASDVPAVRESLSSYRGARFFPVGDATALSRLLADAFLSWRSHGTERHRWTGATWGDVAARYEALFARFKGMGPGVKESV